MPDHDELDIRVFALEQIVGLLLSRLEPNERNQIVAKVDKMVYDRYNEHVA